MTAVDDRPVLALTGVQKSFVTAAGSLPVLDGVDLTVARGEVLAIGGRSGSGKTTLLTIITGWEQPDAGSVEFHIGTPVAAQRRWSELAVVPQSLGLLDELTVAENVTLPLRLAPEASGDDPSELMARLGLGPLSGRYPNEVSLGEQQRAALARAAVIQPQLLVADEPISHQNREWAETMMLVLGLLAAQGTALVLATHDDIAFAGADRVLELHRGRLRPRPG
ncbi:MAG TPA: ATP-binding cassette domain-containing protein [Acidimicrobiales bacterium]